VPILADPNDVTGVLELSQSLPNFDLLRALGSEHLGNFVSVPRLVIGRSQQCENLFSNCPAVFAHSDETILEDVGLTTKYENNYCGRMYLGGRDADRACCRIENEDHEFSLSRRWNHSRKIQQERPECQP